MNADQYRTFIKEVLPPLGYQWRRFERRNTRRKITRRMEQLGIHEPGEYAARLSRDPEETRFLESLLPVTITRFYRNAWLWSELGRLLSEAVGAPAGQGRDLRLWSAGCGGGEEAYTVAMLLDDTFRGDRPVCSWTVLGTDIDRLSLERFQSAQYGWGSVREVPQPIRQRWFSEVNGAWTLDPSIRELVQIRLHDIVRENPPGTFHVVFLRNSIFTYNTERVQRDVLSKILGCLCEPGLLIIGRTEKLPAGEGFEEVGRCIYKIV